MAGLEGASQEPSATNTFTGEARAESQPAVPAVGQDGKATVPEEQDPRAIEKQLDKTKAALAALKTRVQMQRRPELVTSQVQLAFYTDLAEAGVPSSDYESR